MHATRTSLSILDCIGDTPLVALQHVGAEISAPLFAKCEHLNPGGSVKDRLARAIVDDAERRGLLQPGSTLVEATAGNTGLGLALVGAVRGYAVVCVLSEKMSRDKVQALRALGAEVVLTPSVDTDDPRHFRRVAERLAEENGWFLTDQFRNPANARVHEEETGPEILRQVREQTGALPAAFVAGAGTGGTITGVARCFRRLSPETRIVLVDPVGSVLAEYVRTGAHGPAGEHDLEGIGSSCPPEVFDRTCVDEVLSLPDGECFAMTHRLLREEGLLVGGSAGAAVAAAVQAARDPHPPGPVVALLPDAWDRYRTQPWMRAGA